MSAIPCASVNLKTMADGTLRISFDIEPMHAQDAFRLFAAPGTPAAIAALQVGYAQVKEVTDVSAQASQSEKPKGGALSKLAGMWCNDWEFWSWAKVTDAEHARYFVIDSCGIESRAELDHDDAAAERFNRLIRGPYMKYQQARGNA